MLKFARKVVVAVIGTTVLLAGIVMLVTPGPGWGGIFAGLAILATEFAWARRWLRTIRESAERGVDRMNLRPFVERWKGYIREFTEKWARRLNLGSFFNRVRRRGTEK